MALAVWSKFGFYTLQPGQAAVVLQLGKYLDTEEEATWHWHLPPPLQSHVIVNVSSIQREEFGVRLTKSDKNPAGEGDADAAMQTQYNNIVNMSFVVQYRVKDAFQSRYRIANPRLALRDAAQAAIREVVGRTSIDGVLSEQRGQVEVEAEEILQNILDH